MTLESRTLASHSRTSVWRWRFPLSLGRTLAAGAGAMIAHPCGVFSALRRLASHPLHATGVPVVAACWDRRRILVLPLVDPLGGHPLVADGGRQPSVLAALVDTLGVGSVAALRARCHSACLHEHTKHSICR